METRKQRAVIISVSSDIGTAMRHRWVSDGWEVFGTYRTRSQQVEQLTDRNNDLLERLEGIAEDLSETQVAYQTLLGSYNELSGILTSTQSDMQSILASFEELKIQFVEAKVNNSYLIGLYSSVWEKYADLILAVRTLAKEL